MSGGQRKVVLEVEAILKKANKILVIEELCTVLSNTLSFRNFVMCCCYLYKLFLIIIFR